MVSTTIHREVHTKHEDSQSGHPSSDGRRSPPVIFPRRKAGQNKRPAQPVVVTYETLSEVFDLPLWKACKTLGICATAMKKVCRKLGVMKWPYKENHMPGKRVGSKDSDFSRSSSSSSSSQGVTDCEDACESPTSSKDAPVFHPRREPRAVGKTLQAHVPVVRDSGRRKAAAAAAAKVAAVVRAERRGSWASDFDESSSSSLSDVSGGCDDHYSEPSAVSTPCQEQEEQEHPSMAPVERPSMAPVAPLTEASFDMNQLIIGIYDQQNTPPTTLRPDTYPVKSYIPSFALDYPTEGSFSFGPNNKYDNMWLDEADLVLRDGEGSDASGFFMPTTNDREEFLMQQLDWGA